MGKGTKLPMNEVKARVDKCFELRFSNPGNPFGHKEWMEYCKQNYKDKSENTYTDYWMEASRQYKTFWKEKLDKHLAPAVERMTELLNDEDPKVVQKAIDQIFKYSGNEVEKIDMNVEGNIKTNWG
jgi:hypothetical protein